MQYDFFHEYRIDRRTLLFTDKKQPLPVTPETPCRLKKDFTKPAMGSAKKCNIRQGRNLRRPGQVNDPDERIPIFLSSMGNYPVVFFCRNHRARPGDQKAADANFGKVAGWTHFHSS
jgi:hypothetical protein